MLHANIDLMNTLLILVVTKTLRFIIKCNIGIFKYLIWYNHMNCMKITLKHCENGMISTCTILEKHNSRGLHPEKCSFSLTVKQSRDVNLK